MIACPYCGTHYAEFRSNCKNCGAPLPYTELTADEAEPLPAYLEPPPAPRPIPGSYAWRLLAQDSWGIVAGILCFIGAIFVVLGLALTLGVVTAFVGVPFLGLGIVMAGGAAVLLFTRYERARTQVTILQQGQAARGQITELWENTSVSVNERHPWTIRYRFEAGGKAYEGSVTTLHLPGPQHQPGSPTAVLYLPGAPEKNALYPHP